MDVKLLAVIIGIVCGAIRYWFATLFMQPIFRYRELRNNVLSDFIYYAQVINADSLNFDMRNLHRQRSFANRKRSAKLNAAILVLPVLYLWRLKQKGMHSEEAAKKLIRYSNTFEYEQAHKVESTIRKHLGSPQKTC